MPRQMLQRLNGRARSLQQPSSPGVAVAGWQDGVAFAALRDAYRAVGGISPGGVASGLRKVQGRSTFASVPELLATGDIFGFEWDESVWVPMFQFEPRDMSPKPAPRQVRAELGHEFDGWGVCAWFVEPNARLALRRPVDLLDSNLRAVLRAARADHMVGAD